MYRNADHSMGLRTDIRGCYCAVTMYRRPWGGDMKDEQLDGESKSRVMEMERSGKMSVWNAGFDL